MPTKLYPNSWKVHDLLRETKKNNSEKKQKNMLTMALYGKEFEKVLF